MKRIRIKSYIYCIIVVLMLGACRYNNPPEAQNNPTPVTRVDPDPSQKDINETLRADQIKDTIPSDKDFQQDIPVQNIIVDKKQNKAPAKSTKKKQKFAKLVWDSLVHHLPSIQEGEIFEHTFRFENSGQIPLSISSVIPSCGCTMPSYPFLDIDPEEKGEIGITYNSTGKLGMQEAEIIVNANTLPTQTKLKMIFEVLPRKVNEENIIDSLSN